MWSVAPEWQIYFLFPLLLLPICRRLGLVILNLFALLLTAPLHFAFHGRFDHLAPWYVTLFVFGMTAAFISHSKSERLVHVQDRVNWGWLALLLCGGCIILLATKPDWSAARYYASEGLVGLSAAALIVFLSRPAAHEASREGSGIVSRTLIWLGTISYSIYLVHYPLLVAIQAWLRSVDFPAALRVIVTFGVATVVCLAAAYVFHRIFERPFMIGYPRTAEKVATSAAIEPAI